MVSSNGRRSSSKTYTLKEAAHRLGIDQKTLRRKMNVLGLTPKPSEEDKRALLLSGDQVDILASHLRRAPAANVPMLQDLALQIVLEREREWQARGAELTRRERDLMVEVEQLREQVQALMRQNQAPSPTSDPAGAAGAAGATGAAAREQTSPNEENASGKRPVSPPERPGKN